MSKRLRHRHKIRDKELRVSDVIVTGLSGVPSDPFPQTSGPLKMITYNSDFKDVVGNMQSDFNPCQHTKLITSPDIHPIQNLTEYNDDGLRVLNWSFTGFNGVIPKDYHTQLAENFQLPMDEWLEDFSARAEYHFKTAVDVEALLFNFILELIEAMEGNITALKNLAEAIQKALATFKRMYKETGNYWLSWNFAIKPTIADIKAIFGSFKKAQGRLNWLKKHNHRPVKIYYREGPRPFNPVIETGIEYAEFQSSGVDPITGEPVIGVPVMPANWRAETEFEFLTVTLSSWAWVTFDIPDYLLNDTFSDRAVWAAMMGLYNPLMLAWEAVPFSWLIDWFVDQKTRLQIMGADLSPFADAKILGTGWSCKIQGTGKCYITCISGHPRERQRVCDVFYSSYVRQPGLPSDDGNPFRLPLQWYNGSILISILDQYRRR